MGCGLSQGSQGDPDSGGLGVGSSASDPSSSTGSSGSYYSCRPGQPCTGGSFCDGPWSDDSLPSNPWWVRRPPAECQAHLARGTASQPQPLDDCPAWPHDFTPDDCGIPHQQARICVHEQWTETCLVSADCPDGMACVNGSLGGTIHDTDPVAGYGYCQQRCGGPDNIACVRCGQICTNGYCAPDPGGPGPACSGDCECNDGEICVSGHCTVSSAPPQALCGAISEPGATPVDAYGCACGSGTCVFNADTGRGCCHAPDGRLVRSYADPVCTK